MNGAGEKNGPWVATPWMGNEIGKTLVDAFELDEEESYEQDYFAVDENPSEGRGLANSFTKRCSRPAETKLV